MYPLLEFGLVGIDDLVREEVAVGHIGRNELVELVSGGLLVLLI